MSCTPSPILHRSKSTKRQTNFWVSFDLFVCAHFVSTISRADQTDNAYWNDLSRDALHAANKQQNILGKAKNVIIFLGDGMGINTVTSARWLKRELTKEEQLVFETFPNIGLVKVSKVGGETRSNNELSILQTYNVDYVVPDSAGTGTAYLTGVKANKETIGVNAKVLANSANCTLINENRVESVIMQAMRDGKQGGVVTTASITDATPAASYSHVADRYDEAFIANDRMNDPNCKDIARQLIEDMPGINLTVILGGGQRNFVPASSGGKRKDGLNLMDQWKTNKKNAGLSEDQYKLVTTRDELLALDANQVKSVFGLFASHHMLKEQDRLVSNLSQPSLTEMTRKAINLLQANSPNGFFLLVEGAQIDKAHHDNVAYHALHETVEFDKAIKEGMSMVDLTETLILVTADHSHGFNQIGYALRDDDIFGFSRDLDENHENYTQLIYASGPGHRETTEHETEKETSKFES